MAGKGQISIVVEAQDRASATLKNINRSLSEFGLTAAKTGTSASRNVSSLGNALSKIKDATGLSNIGKGISGISTRAKEAGLSLTRIIEPLGIIASAASVGGIVALTTRLASFGATLGRTSNYLRMTTDGYQGLVNAGRIAGVSTQAMEAGIDGLNTSLHDAVGGRAPEAVLFFNKLGVSFRDTQGDARSVTDVLPELADKIAGIKDPYIQAAIAQKLFGSSARDMLPFLQRNSAGLKEFQALAIKHGLVNDEGAKSARQLEQAQTELTMSVEGLGYAVASKLAPVLVPALNGLTNWIDQHREGIGQFFASVAAQISSWVEGGGIQKTVTALSDFGSGVSNLVRELGGWKAVSEELFALWAAGKVLGIVSQIAKLTGAVRTLTSAFSTELPAGIKVGQAAMNAFSATSVGLPIWGKVGTLAGTLLQLYNKGLPDNDTLPDDSPLKLNRDGSPTAPSWYDLHAPTWLGGNAAAQSHAARGGYDKPPSTSAPATTTSDPAAAPATMVPPADPAADANNGQGTLARLGQYLADSLRVRGWSSDNSATSSGARDTQADPQGLVVPSSGGGLLSTLGHWLIPGAAAASRLPAGTTGGTAAPNTGSYTHRLDAAGTKAASNDSVDYLMSKGWTREAASGASANLNVESGFDTHAIGDSGQAFGMMQWHSDRQNRIEEHFKKSLADMSRHEQLDAVDWETRTATPGAFIRMQHAGAGEAGAIFSREVERPRDVDGEASRRSRLAEKAFSVSLTAPSGPPVLPPAASRPIINVASPASAPAPVVNVAAPVGQPVPQAPQASPQGVQAPAVVNVSPQPPGQPVVVPAPAVNVPPQLPVNPVVVPAPAVNVPPQLPGQPVVVPAPAVNVSPQPADSPMPQMLPLPDNNVQSSPLPPPAAAAPAPVAAVQPQQDATVHVLVSAAPGTTAKVVRTTGPIRANTAPALSFHGGY